MRDLAKSSEFASLVETVALYKRACFGNDNILVDAAAMRELILEAETDPTVLRVAEDSETKSEPSAKELDIEKDYEDEINNKLMLCRFYGLETSHGTERQQPLLRAAAPRAPRRRRRVGTRRSVDEGGPRR